MKKVAIALVGAFGLAFGGAPAVANGLTSEEVKTAITEAGATPTFADGVWKVPLNEQLDFYVQPASCDEATAKCKVFTVFVNFQSTLPASKLLELANDHNKSTLASRALLTNGRVFLQYQILLSDGAGAAYFKSRLGEFPQLLQVFLDKVYTPSQEAAAGS